MKITATFTKVFQAVVAGTSMINVSMIPQKYQIYVQTFIGCVGLVQAAMASNRHPTTGEKLVP